MHDDDVCCLCARRKGICRERERTRHNEPNANQTRERQETLEPPKNVAQNTACYRATATGAVAAVVNAGGGGGAGGGDVIREPEVAPRLGAVEVLNPSCRMTASKSAFCTGFDK